MPSNPMSPDVHIKICTPMADRYQVSSAVSENPARCRAGSQIRGSGAQPSYGPHLLHVGAEMLEQVLDAVPQRGGRARAARAGAAHVQEDDAVLEALEDD